MASSMASGMSAGLQHAAGAASFFPTAKELSSGVQWFKDHPVLAAAAATAVSVITYLNATERGEEEAALADALPPVCTEAERLDRREEQLTTRPALKSAVRSPLADGSALERRSSGEGKLSAAVSWCDEHGGSLTQVFEDEDDEEVDEVDLDLPLRLLDTRRRPPRRRTSVSSTASSSSSEEGEKAGAMRKSATAARLLDPLGPASPGASGPVDDPLQAESPQWGWYVPITPPQDQFVAAQPRAMVAMRPISAGDPRRGA